MLTAMSGRWSMAASRKFIVGTEFPPGKFLERGAIVDVIKSQERTNAIQKREGLSNHPVRFTVCGCPDPKYGGWHTIVTDRQIPTADECEALLRAKPLKSGGSAT